MLVCNILLTLHAALFLEMPGYRMSGHVIGYLGWVASMVKAETDCWIYCMSYFHISVVQSEGVLSSVQLKEMNVNLINKKSMLSSFAFPNAEYSGPLIGAQSIIHHIFNVCLHLMTDMVSDPMVHPGASDGLFNTTANLRDPRLLAHAHSTMVL
jgi:hypothetical protein